MINKNLFEKYKNQIKKLEKKDIDLIISDFDDTIFCRNEQLNDSELLRNNRWEAWNEKIFNEIWLENYWNKYYKNKKYPNIISSKLKKWIDLILTAWRKELQECKLNHTWLINHNYIVVKNAEDKIIETIKYITENLQFLPNKITIFEDRPKYFIENKKLIENTLWIPLEIMYVEMKDNYTKPKIRVINIENWIINIENWVIKLLITDIPNKIKEIVKK